MRNPVPDPKPARTPKATPVGYSGTLIGLGRLIDTPSGIVRKPRPTRWPKAPQRNY